jgi:phosphoserine phosphatase
MTTRVILVRHGQSTYNADKRYQGCSDESVLTARGYEMATQTGTLLKNIAIDAIYSSPLKRTRQTAQVILKSLDTPLDFHCHDNLKEIAMPEWEGLTFKYVRSHLAESYRCWKERPHEFQMRFTQVASSCNRTSTLTKKDDDAARSGFPVLDLYAQAQQFWQDVLPRHADATILVVSHGGTIRALISTAIGMGCQSFHALQQSNCGVSMLNFPQGVHYPAQLAAMNITHHLGEALPKLKEGKVGLRLLLVLAENGDYLPELTQLLQPTKLDLCLSCDHTDVLAQALLNQRPEPTVHLGTAQDNFWETWQQTLQTQSCHSEALTTGLILASPATIHRMLAQTLDIPATPAVFDLKPGSLSIVQYPINQRPVLQALNFSG